MTAYSGLISRGQPNLGTVAVVFLFAKYNAKAGNLYLACQLGGNMSFRAMTWAASVKTNTATQKLVLLLLADRTGDDESCYPSLNRIADDACISRRCVIENIKKLAVHGFLSVEKRTIEHEETGKAWNKSNLYILHVGSFPLGMSNPKHGVVNSVHGGGEPSALGVVNSVHPNHPVEPPIKSEATQSNFSIADAVQIYHDSCVGLRKVQKITDDRRRAFNARMNEWGEDAVRNVFKIVSSSDFLMGRLKNKGTWRPDFDFILTPKGFTKIMEGKYANAEKPQPTQVRGL